jgi:hypothetical protein
MIAWTQRYPRRRNLIIGTVIFSLAVGLFLGVRGQSLVYTGLSYAAACRGDLHNDLAWDERAFGFATAIAPVLDAAADRVPADAARELALSKCSMQTVDATSHLRRALAIAPMSSYVLLQVAFDSLPVDPRVARALVERDPSDYVAVMVDRVATFRAGGDSNSDPDIVRGLTRYRFYADPQHAQTWFIDSLSNISMQRSADIQRRHGTKEREIAAYRAAARDIIASAPPHLDPQILAFAEHGTLPQPSTRQTRPTR